MDNTENDNEMFLRKRVRDPSPNIIDDPFDGELSDALSEDEDNGCPLPSTPEDTELLEAEVNCNSILLQFSLKSESL
jgi:hypothetical protein